MALDRLPGAARGDAHFLVVVTGRTTAGESVVQPEAVGLAHAVGDVGEGRRALVGGHDQIGVVAFPGHDVGRTHRGAFADDVVGDVQHAGQEGLIGADGFGLHFLARAADRQLLGIEAALGADRHDDRVLDLLGLHQTQNLGAEVVATV